MTYRDMRHKAALWLYQYRAATPEFRAKIVDEAQAQSDKGDAVAKIVLAMMRQIEATVSVEQTKETH